MDSEWENVTGAVEDDPTGDTTGDEEKTSVNLRRSDIKIDHIREHAKQYPKSKLLNTKLACYYAHHGRLDALKVLVELGVPMEIRLNTSLKPYISAISSAVMSDQEEGREECIMFLLEHMMSQGGFKKSDWFLCACVRSDRMDVFDRWCKMNNYRTNLAKSKVYLDYVAYAGTREMYEDALKYGCEVTRFTRHLCLMGGNEAVLSRMYDTGVISFNTEDLSVAHYYGHYALVHSLKQKYCPAMEVSYDTQNYLTAECLLYDDNPREMLQELQKAHMVDEDDGHGNTAVYIQLLFA